MMKKTKMKFIAVLLLIVMLTSFLVACNSAGSDTAAQNKTDSSSEAKTGDSGKTQITFWHSMGGVGEEGIKELVSRFNSSQDEIEVITEFQGAYDDALNKLRSASSAADAGVDVVQVFDLGTRFMIDSGWIVPVQNYIDSTGYDINNIEPNLAAYYTVDGKLNSMPFNSSTPLLYYNKDIFKKAGIENPPTSLEEILEIGEVLKTKGGAEMPIAISIYGWWVEQWMSKAGGEMFDNGNGRTASPTSVEFVKNGKLEKILSMWHGLETKGFAPNVGRSGGSAEFISGKAAMAFALTASLRNLLNEVGDKFELGTAYFPGALKEDTNGVSIGGASLYIMDSGDTAKTDAAWKFIEFMISPKSQAYWNAQTGYFPINVKSHDEDVFKDNLAKYPQFETAIKQLHDTTPQAQGALCAVYQETRQIMEKEIENLMNGLSEPAETVQKIGEQVNQSIENYNRVNAK